MVDFALLPKGKPQTSGMATMAVGKNVAVGWTSLPTPQGIRDWSPERSKSEVDGTWSRRIYSESANKSPPSGTKETLRKCFFSLQYLES